MKTTHRVVSKAPDKAPTGIIGFDDITGGGLPRGRTTLLVGGPGSGKTVFALEFLVHGARSLEEPGIFVAFEESSQRILANAHSFDWNLPGLQGSKLSFVDAQPAADLMQSGEFDLGGLLAALQAMVTETGAQRIVFDALDVMLALLSDSAARRTEIYRLHDWLLKHELTAVITAKAGADERTFMQFMVDCAVILGHEVVKGVSQRNLRVQKYRGTRFDENQSPFLIGNHGLEVEVAVARPLERGSLKASSERVSSGVERLDTMLGGGGYYRGASVLITGFPGTAKTTLCGTFAEAACQRSERTLFVSFDSDANEVIRDLASVGIRLARHEKSGHLRMVSARTIAGSAELYLARIKALAKEHEARCVVIDPVSTWSKSGSDLSAYSIAERLINWSKAEGITLLCSSLLDEMALHTEGGSSLQISELADTWIHLNHMEQAGERNRSLSIIKSRGTAHSNQVRELILSDEGVTLADTYAAGGEVLMGTLRWQKERAEHAAAEVTEVAGRLKRVRLEAEEAELEVQLKSLGVELEAKKVEKSLLERTTATREGELARGRTRIGELRGADVDGYKDKESPT
ncbi:MAG: circadian clock protein KaiC [Xanthomonadaceae bacterium]|nr:circadian clock protein KaiC [Xanthomonadaceae bacterium]